MKPLRSTYPPSSLLGGAAYTPSVATDIRETLRRERERIDAERATDIRETLRRERERIDAERAKAMREAEERDTEACDER